MSDEKWKAEGDGNDAFPKKGKGQWHQKFKEEYHSKYPFIIKSDKGPSYAKCTICASDINICHGGINDINKHISTSKHKLALESGDSSKKIESFFIKKSESSAVIKAECLFTSFIIEHNLPISVADHASKLFPKIFPDSDTAKKYSSGRTKTTAIMNEMAKDVGQTMVSALEKKAFTLSTDGSNDVDMKLYPIVLTYVDEDLSKVVNCLLSVPNLEGKSTGENIANWVSTEILSHGLDIKNCVSLGVDNANVMIGKHKGVAAFLLKKNSKMIIRGCPCHLIHLAAEKAAKTLPYQFDEILVDLFYYLEKSANRKQELTNFQNMCDTDTERILKHVCTRWLSMGACLNRLINQWLPLKKYFESKMTDKDKNESTKKSETEVEQRSHTKQKTDTCTKKKTDTSTDASTCTSKHKTATSTSKE